MRIKITAGKVSLYANLNDTPTAKKIEKILPFRSPFNQWGDEIYFPIPVESELDNSARDEVKIGELGYWPTGRAFCIFFGPTPISQGGKIIPASAVNIIGRMEGDPTILRQVLDEKEIIVEKSTIINSPPGYNGNGNGR